MNTYIKERREEGFTLIELLIAIVVVGILTAVVIVGIGGLADNGKNSACAASKDAAKAAQAVHYNNTNGHNIRTSPVMQRQKHLAQGAGKRKNGLEDQELQNGKK